MNIAELKVLISGDDSGAQSALRRTSQALADTTQYKSVTVVSDGASWYSMATT